MQVTKGDFDKAVAVPWSYRTCLIAQLVIRLCGTDDGDVVCLGMYSLTDASKKANRLMRAFDVAHDRTEANPDRLAEIRKQLPITI